MNLINNILVPTDFSVLSFAGVEYANALRKHDDAEIHLVYVIESFSSRQTPYVDECSETVLRDNDNDALPVKPEEMQNHFMEREDIDPVKGKLVNE